MWWWIELTGWESNHLHYSIWWGVFRVYLKRRCKFQKFLLFDWDTQNQAESSRRWWLSFTVFALWYCQQSPKGKMVTGLKANKRGLQQTEDFLLPGWLPLRLHSWWRFRGPPFLWFEPHCSSSWKTDLPKQQSYLATAKLPPNFRALVLIAVKLPPSLWFTPTGQLKKILWLLERYHYYIWCPSWRPRCGHPQFHRGQDSRASPPPWL